MPSKFGNVPKRGYHSTGEADRAQELHLLQQIGEITDLKEQVDFEVVPKCGKNLPVIYRADFTYFEGPRFVVEDFKGMRTKEFIIKKKLMLHVHGIDIRETSAPKKRRSVRRKR